MLKGIYLNKKIVTICPIIWNKIKTLFFFKKANQTFEVFFFESSIAFITDKIMWVI